MGAKPNATSYLLGNTDAEHERLIRQAVLLAPITEGFFREAGIGPGQRVLDLGSGVGDVSMLAARLVGTCGEVVGVEHDARSIERAKRRCSEADLHNVHFIESDIAQFTSDTFFDAVVGRYILQFLPDPAGVLRSVSRFVKPSGVIAFQENSWAPFVLLSEHVPLLFAGVSLIYEVSRRFGVNTELGPALHKAFRDAGLPAPNMRLEVPLGCTPEFTRWVSDAVRSLQPQFERFNVSLDALGDLDTLQARIHEEVTTLNTVVPLLPLVGAWCRTPGDKRLPDSS